MATATATARSSHATPNSPKCHRDDGFAAIFAAVSYSILQEAVSLLFGWLVSRARLPYFVRNSGPDMRSTP